MDITVKKTKGDFIMKKNIAYGLIAMAILISSMIGAFFDYHEVVMDGYKVHTIALTPCMYERTSFCTNPDEIQITSMLIFRENK